jgi:hypothetical protein
MAVDVATEDWFSTVSELRMTDSDIFKQLSTTLFPGAQKPNFGLSYC